MPTYDYVCDGCGHAFEEFQSMTEDPLKKCPQCKKKKLRRLLGTGAAIIFKGSGFYQTDYRSDSYKSAAKADEGKSSAGSSDASKSDSSKSEGTSAKSSGDTDKSSAAKPAKTKKSAEK